MHEDRGGPGVVMPEKLEGMLAALAIYHPNSTPILRTAILAALAQREAETVERCCKAVCPYCDEGSPVKALGNGTWTHDLDANDRENNPLGFGWDNCKAGRIRRALAAPATEGKP